MNRRGIVRATFVLILCLLILTGGDFDLGISLDPYMKADAVEAPGITYTTHDVIMIQNDTDLEEQAEDEGWNGSGTIAQCHVSR